MFILIFFVLVNVLTGVDSALVSEFQVEAT